MSTTTVNTPSPTPTTTNTTTPTLATSTTPTTTSSPEATSNTTSQTTEQSTAAAPSRIRALEDWHIGLISVGGVVFVAIFVAIFVVVCLKRRRREKHDPPMLPVVDETGREVSPQPLQPRPPVSRADYGVEEDEISGPTSYTYVDPGNPTHVPVITDSLQGRGDVYENFGGDVSTGTYIVPIDRLPHHGHSEPRLEDATYMSMGMPMGPPVCRPNGPGYVNLPHDPPPDFHTQVSGGHYENSSSDGPEYGNVLTHSPSLAHTGPSKTPTPALSPPHSYPNPLPSLANTGSSKTPTTVLSHPHSLPKPHPSKGGHVPQTALKPKLTASHGKPRVSPKPKERANTAPITYQPSPVPLTPRSTSQDDSDSGSNPGEDYINLESGEGEGHNYVNAPEKKVQTKPRTAKRVANGSSAPS